MTREEAKEILQGSRITSFRPNGTARVKEALDLAIEALSQPIVCKDYCIDDDHIYCSPKVAERVVEALSAEAVDCTDFIRWLTETVMDDGMWELNAVAYGEVIARKLTKLGVLEVKDDVHVYEPSAEAEPKQVEKCDECIHKGTHKDKITCKECASADAVQRG